MASDERDLWLEGLKEGDPVVVYGGFGMDTPFLYKVEKASKTQIIVKGSKYRRADGRAVHGDRWQRQRLDPFTPAVEEQIRRRRLLAVIEKTDWKTLTTPLLEDIVQRVTVLKQS